MFDSSNDDSWRNEMEVRAPSRTPEQILAGLTPAQAAAASHSGPALVLAGAGSGKTRTLTTGIAYRIEHWGVPANRILAVTFTNKAAREMKDRVARILGDLEAPSWLGTFSGLGARQLRAEPEVGYLRPRFEIYDADDSKRLVRRVMKEMSIDPEDCSDGKVSDPVKTVYNRIGSFKESMITPDEAASQVETMIARANAARDPIDAAGIRITARIYVEYQRRLREANAADFGDLLLWPTVAMKNDEVYRKRWAGRFDCLMADEYQDINYVQYVWLWLLAKDHHQIFGVGDDDQSIFGWRGSDVAYIRRFTTDFAEAKTFLLEENFRSTAHIVAAAAGVIAKDPNRLEKTLRATRPQGEKIEVVKFNNGKDEALGIAAEIGRRHGLGRAWNHMAILYRNNRMSRLIEESLMRSQIPYVLVGDVGFYQRQEVKDTLALLRLAMHPDEVQGDEAFRRVCNLPRRGLGDVALQEVGDEAAFRGCSLLHALETAKLPPKARSAGLSFVDAIRAVHANTTSSLADQISMLVDKTGYRAMWRDSRAEDAEGRLENIRELISLAEGFHIGDELLEHAALATGAPGEEDTVDRVQLMTLHKAKGLEFPDVFLPGWEMGSFPANFGDFDEERRLAYVGLTRGMESVTVTHVEFRQGQAVPSVFIDDIPKESMVLGWRHRQRVPSSMPPVMNRKSSFPGRPAMDVHRRF